MVRKSSKNTKTMTTPTVKPQEEENKGNNNIYVNVYPILQLNCIVDGVELSWRDIKKALNNTEGIQEIKIFGISNKLYKEIINYLKEENIKYVVYERSRIGLY